MGEKYGMSWTAGPIDAKLYDLDGPQEFDAGKLNDMKASELDQLERVIVREAGLSLEMVWPPVDRRVGASRAMMWLTLRLQGRDIEWEDFDPRVRRTVFDWRVNEPEAPEGDDVDPPAESPAETSLPAEE